MATDQNCTHLILGAWGCGVFNNHPKMVASTFKQLLEEYPYFDVVLFAVLDFDQNKPTLNTFTYIIE